MNLLIVIVNFRTPDLTIDCLRSLSPEVGSVPDSQVVVTDNASGDDSLERLQNAVHDNGWNSWARIKPLERNGGFAFGNNGAIHPALMSTAPPRYVLLLNSDTIVLPGALKTLVDFMDSRPDVGIAGGRNESRDRTPQISTFRFHSVLSELEDGLRLGLSTKLLARWKTSMPVPHSTCQVDWVCGACMIIRREVFESIGLLDDQYFMYYEEVDFCLRARRAGWPCWYVPEAGIIHLIGGSTDASNPVQMAKRKPSYFFESRHRYFVTNHGIFGAALLDLAWASGYAIYELRRFIQRKPDVNPKLLLWDYICHSVKPLSKSDNPRPLTSV